MNEPGSETYHLPVLAAAVTELLVTDPNGVYIDLTVGGGGHLQALAKVLTRRARLYGVDKDPQAVEKAGEVLAQYPNFKKIIQRTFSQIETVAGEIKEDCFDGILLDLGLSSKQIDDPRRGFSFQSEGPLDMRFDPTRGQSAGDLVNTLDENELYKIIKEYGEERQARRLAREIVKERQKGMILTTAQLTDIISTAAHPSHRIKTLARVFQALRIAVNGELEELEQTLPRAITRLRRGGRLAVIAYHSLEDRLVKRYFQGNAKSRSSVPVEFLAHGEDIPPQLKIITRKPVIPSREEIAVNSRARSARLRVAEKL